MIFFLLFLALVLFFPKAAFLGAIFFGIYLFCKLMPENINISENNADFD